MTQRPHIRIAAPSSAKRLPLPRARDLAEHALPTIALTRLVAAGKIERVARGVYSLPRRKLSEHRSRAEANLRVPQGVECLLSALRAHGIGTQAPFEVWHDRMSRILTDTNDSARSSRDAGVTSARSARRMQARPDGTTAKRP